ncbi:predicted protein [Streptomyces sp. C]|nr:predicted protein [Streptomyces sp. C]
MMGGMPQPSAPRKALGRPPRISREQTIETARRTVDEGGVDRLTMRRLAAEVGGTPMALSALHTSGPPDRPVLGEVDVLKAGAAQELAHVEGGEGAAEVGVDAVDVRGDLPATLR